MTGEHTSHNDVLKRLKRASGHLSKVIQMIEGEQPCLAVSQQLQAVVSALNNAKKIFVHDHIEHCFQLESDNVQEAQSKINELKEISKYL